MSFIWASTDGLEPFNLPPCAELEVECGFIIFFNILEELKTKKRRPEHVQNPADPWLDAQ